MIMSMKRIIDPKLAEWKTSRFRKPLIIRGARQVGKTYSVTRFGQTRFDTFLSIDFERDRTVHRIFEQDLSAARLIMELEVWFNTRIIPGTTLLFFDEIQECPRAVLSLRYFYEERPDLHIIAAGSMLEFTLGEVSFPVGRVSFEWMRPMTFYEFLNALDLDLLAEKMPHVFDENPVPVSPAIHTRLIEQLKRYLVTGGMPEAVERYRQTGSLVQSAAVHEEIFQSYLQSLIKYNQRADADSLDLLMRSLPRHVGSQIKYTRLAPDQRIEKTKTSLDILEKALIVQTASAADAAGLPLNAHISAKKIKPLFLDVGLMQYVCGIDPAAILADRDLSLIYKGALAEQFVGQELLAAGGSENGKLFYWARNKKNSNAEVDYLAVHQGTVFPIEVKSGPAGKLKSLHLFLAEHPQVTKGIVMSPAGPDCQQIEKLFFLPIYARFN
jgi:uncharacterized protein